VQGLLKRARSPKRRAEYEAKLHCPPLPKALGHVWNAFHRLRRRKGSNGFALSPIGWPDIDAFVRFSGVRLTPWEVELVEDLDNLFLANAIARETEEDQDA
jgi:hypothetical protein